MELLTVKQQPFGDDTNQLRLKATFLTNALPPKLEADDKSCRCPFCYLKQKEKSFEEYYKALDESINSLNTLKEALKSDGVFDNVCPGHIPLLLKGHSLKDMEAVASACIYIPIQDWLKPIPYWLKSFEDLLM